MRHRSLAPCLGTAPIPSPPEQFTRALPHAGARQAQPLDLPHAVKQRVLSYLGRADFIRLGNANSFWRAASWSTELLVAQLGDPAQDFDWPVLPLGSSLPPLGATALRNELLRRLRVQRQYGVGAMQRINLAGGSAPLVFCAFVNKGSHVLMVLANGTVRMADLAQRYIETREILRDGPCFCRTTLAVSATGTTLATAMGPNSNTVVLFTLGRTRAAPRRVAVHPEAVRAVALSANGRMLATASVDGEIRVCDTLRPRAAPMVAKLTGDQVASVRFGPYGRLFVVCVQAGDRAYVLDLANAAKPESYLVANETGRLHAMAFVDDGAALVTGTGDGYTTLWEFRQPAPTMARLAWQDGSVRSVAVPGDVPLVLTAGTDGTAWLLDLGCVPPRHRVLAGHTAAVTQVAFSPCTRFALTAAADGTVRIWDISRPAPSFINLPAGSAPVVSAENAPDGRFVLTVCADGTVNLWDFDPDVGD